MEETTNTTAGELSADQQDAFLEGWGDEGSEVEQAADQPTEQIQEQAQSEAAGESQPVEPSAEAAQADSGTDSQTRENGAEESKAQPLQQEAAQHTWTVKHMDQSRTLRVEDVTPELLQKGLDYDRIREKYDEAKPIMAMFGQFATQAGLSIPEYAKLIRSQAKQAGGMSEAEAKKTVELEDREAAVMAREAQQQASARSNQDRAARVRADLADFAKAFPDVHEQAKRDRTAIPESVWKDVNAGLPLTAAYARYAVAQAQQAEASANARAANAEQNRANTQRSTGSMKSVGNDGKNKDPFLEGWDS